MAPRALRHKQRNYYFCILQSRNDCGHSGFAFSREGVVTGSGICFANRSAAQKSHWGFHALRAPPSFLVLFWRAKENVSGGNAFYKSHTNLPHTNTHCTRSSLSSRKSKTARPAELVGARPLHLAPARTFCRLKAPLGLSLLRNRGLAVLQSLKIIFPLNMPRAKRRAF